MPTSRPRHRISSARPRARLGSLLGPLVLGILAVAALGLAAATVSVPRSTAAEMGPAAPTTTAPALRPAVVAAERVLLLGDSTMDDASPALTAMFQASGSSVVSAPLGGFGLTQVGMGNPTSPFRTDWARLVEEEEPELVVVMLGLWDQRYVEVNGILAYAAIVQEAVEILTAGGGRVLWLSLPPGGLAPERIQDGAFEMVAAMHPGSAVYADVESSQRGPEGDWPVSYRAADGTVVHLRKADGFHFCPDGAQRLAELVDRVATREGLTTATPDGWQQGSWRSSPLYDDPSCTDAP